MTPTERRALGSLTGVFMLRMLGLFMLLPVLALYADGLAGATPLMVGLAVGVYGLTQGLLQIPSGMASDRWGRKPVILTGLVVFVAGSLLAAMSESVLGLVIGRAIQGAGAISAAILALTADLTREEHRTRAMAVIGVSIGFAFLLSLMVAPPLQSFIGVPGIFVLTAVLGSLAMLIVWRVVPDPERTRTHRDVTPERTRFAEIIRDRQLLRLDAGIFLLHMVLTALFVVLPGQLVDVIEVPVGRHWQIYIPVLLLSVAGMVPLIRFGSRNDGAGPAFRMAIALLVLALLVLTIGSERGPLFLLIGLFVFFTAFNALEAMLPSLVSRLAPAAGKGTAIGVYNSSQFIGMFVGGAAAGVIGSRYGIEVVYLFCLVCAAGWWVLAATASPFNLAGSAVISVGDRSDSQRRELVDKIRALDGVRDVTLVRGDSVAYLKVDDETFDRAQLQQLIRT